MADGHNDITTDNAFFWRDADHTLRFGLVDWQQACVNNVAQEWAWNWHWLPPPFLDKHEDTLIDAVLAEYRRGGS